MKKKIVFVVNDIGYFISHRLALAKKLTLKFEITVISPEIDKYSKKLLKKYKINFESLFLKKNSTFLIYEILSFFHLIVLLSKHRNSIIHLVTIKPIFYGSIVTYLLGLKNVVYSYSGLGYYFNKKTLITKILINILKNTVNKNHKFIFHNKNDYLSIKNNKIIKKNDVFFTIGSGVDLNDYFFIKKKTSKFTVGFFSRILIDKGIYEFLNGLSIVKKRIDVEVIIAGKIYTSNPSAINKDSFFDTIKKNKFKYLGQKKNINKLINKCDVIILPSYHEGTPKILLEAAACGKSIICSDVPGCKNVVKNNFNGLLVPIKNHIKISDAVIKIFLNKNLRNKFKKNNLKLAKKHFSIQKVINTHLKVYEKFK